MIVRDQWTFRRHAAPVVLPSIALAQSPTSSAQAIQTAAALRSLEEDLYTRVVRSTPTEADPITGIVAPGKEEPAHQPFDLTAVNTMNPVIQGAQGYRIAVHMLFMYNAGDAQTISVYDGLNGNVLTGPLVALAGGVGLFLPWTDVAYFTLGPGNAFIISTDNVANPRITGFVKYRLADRGNS